MNIVGLCEYDLRRGILYFVWVVGYNGPEVRVEVVDGPAKRIWCKVLQCISKAQPR